MADINPGAFRLAEKNPSWSAIGGGGQMLLIGSNKFNKAFWLAGPGWSAIGGHLDGAGLLRPAEGVEHVEEHDRRVDEDDQRKQGI